MPNAIPEGLSSITAQLVVDGAAEAIAVFQKAFCAQEVMRAPDPSGKKVWHAIVRIGNTSLFVNDAFPEMGATATPTRLWLYLDGVDAAFQRAVEAGATVRMPLTDMFWGDRLGAVVDRWGNQWPLAQHMKDLSPQQMKEAQDVATAQWKPAENASAK